MSCMICDIEYVCMECEQLKGLKMNSDLLDMYCKDEFGHKDWAMAWDDKGNLVVTFYAEPREGYFSEEEEDEDVSS